MPGGKKRGFGALGTVKSALALAPEGLEGQNVKMGKAKSVRNFAFLSPVLMELDGVLLFFRLFGAVVIYIL